MRMPTHVCAVSFVRSAMLAACMSDSGAVILDKYQEQPQLLDSHLPSFVTRLLELSRDIALARVAPALAATERHLRAAALLRIVYAISKVRGIKSVTKLFPHAPSDLEAVLDLAETFNVTWNGRFILFSWLAALALVPFDMAVFAPRAAERLCELAISQLASPAASRSAAALLLARVITRTDMFAVMLPRFVDAFMALLSSIKSDALDASTTLLLIGHLEALCASFKVGRCVMVCVCVMVCDGV
jgi:tubulin-specific chaperone D